MSDDVDKQNLDDLEATQQALTQAKNALEKAMAAHGPRERERFAFNVGFMRGRIARIADRIYPAKGDDDAS